MSRFKVGLDCAEEFKALIIVKKPLHGHYEAFKHVRVKEEVGPNYPVKLVFELEQLGVDQDKGTTCTLSSKLLSLTASVQFLTQ